MNFIFFRIKSHKKKSSLAEVNAKSHSRSRSSRQKQINTFHLFVDCKSAFDTPDRDHLYTTMSEFGIPAKLIRFCEITLKNAQCVVKVGDNLSEPFDAKRGFRQGASCDFYNILMEQIICAAGLRHTATIFYKSIMPLAYADDVDIIGRSICEVEAAFSKFAEEARSIGLAEMRARQSCFYQQLRILA